MGNKHLQLNTQQIAILTEQNKIQIHLKNRCFPIVIYDELLTTIVLTRSKRPFISPCNFNFKCGDTSPSEFSTIEFSSSSLALINWSWDVSPTEDSGRDEYRSLKVALEAPNGLAFCELLKASSASETFKNTIRAQEFGWKVSVSTSLRFPNLLYISRRSALEGKEDPGRNVTKSDAGELPLLFNPVSSSTFFRLALADLALGLPASCSDSDLTNFTFLLFPIFFSSDEGSTP